MGSGEVIEAMGKFAIEVVMVTVGDGCD